MLDVVSVHYGSSDSSVVYKGTTKVVSRFCVCVLYVTYVSVCKCIKTVCFSTSSITYIFNLSAQCPTPKVM